MSDTNRVSDERLAELRELLSDPGRYTMQTKWTADMLAVLDELLARRAADAQTPDTRLQHARDAATYAAWRDMLSKFSQEQREQIAMLLAHDWLITGITLSHDDGRLFHMDAKDYWPPYFSGVKSVPPPPPTTTTAEDGEGR